MTNEQLDQRARTAIGHGLPAMREASYRARRVLRAPYGHKRDALLRKLNFVNDRDNRLLAQFVRVLPPLLALHCVAKAEALAIEIIIKEYEDELQAR